MIRPTYRIIALNQACASRKARSAKLTNINLPRTPKVSSILFRCNFEKNLERLLIILKNMLLQMYLQSRKLSVATKKAPRYCMWPASPRTPESVGMKGKCPLPNHEGATGAEVDFPNSITAHFMVCKDRLETILL